MNEPRSIHAAEDWGVVLQSVPSKNKKEIVKRLEEIFDLERRDAEQVLSNMPLILIDNISFGLAARIKKFFQTVGAVAETTNHDMIKKNCFQVLWPQTPDLAFFMKNETAAAEAPVEEKSPVKPAEVPPVATKVVTYEKRTETPKIHVTPLPAEPDEEFPPIVLHRPTVSSKPAQESPAKEFSSHPVPEEKSATASSPGVDPDWERRAKEAEAWRSKAMALGEKVRGLEADLAQKTSAIENLIQKKNDSSGQSEKAAELASRVADLEKIVAARDEERSALQGRASDLEKNISAAQRELENYRSREKEWSQKGVGLAREVQEMKESLKARDGALAQFEKQEEELSGKVREFEPVRQEHARLLQERATIRQEYDAKLVELEGRLLKLEEEYRRYRSRTERKNAAAIRELGEWIRGVDTLRQGLQKLILFLGSESAVLDVEKKSALRSPLTRGPDAPPPEKS